MISLTGDYVNKRYAVLYQFVRFCVVGASNTAVSYVTYILFLNFTGILFVANAMGFVISLVNAFLWNNSWVFKKGANERRSAIVSFFKMCVTYSLTGVFLNYGLLYVWIYCCGISELIAPLINSVVGIPINFSINKLWCFKTKNLSYTK